MLLSYANDMIDINKIRLGKFEATISECSIDSVVSGIVSMLRYFANLKNLHLSYTIDELVPQLLHTDK